MKTIGQILKEARLKKRFSLKKMEEATKIKSSFVEKIEKEDWSNLPPFSITLGFIKKMAKEVGIEEKTAVAVLRRDYIPKPQAITPKPDVGKKFVWGPKLTFSIGVIAIIAVVIGYLIFQYAKFLSAPSLSVTSPKEGEVITQYELSVSGKTDSDAKILVNNQPVIVDDNGNFTTTLDINKETSEVDVVATSRSGKVTEIRRKIEISVK